MPFHRVQSDSESLLRNRETETADHALLKQCCVYNAGIGSLKIHFTVYCTNADNFKIHFGLLVVI